MTTARLTYDGNNIDFPYGIQTYDLSPMQESSRTKSASGIPEQINVYGCNELQITALLTQTAYNQFYNWWWSWARSGGEFSFTLDSTNTVNTTLDGAANSGQKVIPLTATTNLAVDDVCQVIADGDNAREIVTIASISAGVSVTVDDNLLTSFASGDAFVHFDYFPALMTSDDSYKPTYMGGGLYNVVFNWYEVLS